MFLRDGGSMVFGQCFSPRETEFLQLSTGTTSAPPVSQFITHFRCGFFSKLKVTDSCLVVKNNLFFKNIF
jgi:hypothetical protein